MKLATVHPFPEKLALAFLKERTEVLVLEELDPVIEEVLLKLCGKHQLPVKIYGKLTGHANIAGSNNYETIRASIDKFYAREISPPVAVSLPPLPARPPVLCAGCPHRASFYSVKRALQQQKQEAVFQRRYRLLYPWQRQPA